MGSSMLACTHARSLAGLHAPSDGKATLAPARVPGVASGRTLARH